MPSPNRPAPGQMFNLQTVQQLALAEAWQRLRRTGSPGPALRYLSTTLSITWSAAAGLLARHVSDLIVTHPQPPEVRDEDTPRE